MEDHSALKELLRPSGSGTSFNAGGSTLSAGSSGRDGELRGRHEQSEPHPAWLRLALSPLIASRAVHTVGSGTYGSGRTSRSHRPYIIRRDTCFRYDSRLHGSSRSHDGSLGEKR